MNEIDNNIIKILNVSKYFGILKILDCVSLDIRRGEVISIIGPSGSGKSTLLRCINGLEPIDSGTILIDQVDIRKHSVDIDAIRSGIGMVFQSFNLFRHMTVIENLTFAPKEKKLMSEYDANNEAMYLLERFGLRGKANHYPHQLSGGEKQRIAILRAIMMRPKIILFDEPTRSLDPIMTREVQHLIRSLIDNKTTFVIVTHEMEFARELADRIVFLNKGKIIEQGKPEEVLSFPKEIETKMFLSKLI